MSDNQSSYFKKAHAGWGEFAEPAKQTAPAAAPAAASGGPTAAAKVNMTTNTSTPAPLTPAKYTFGQTSTLHPTEAVLESIRTTQTPSTPEQFTPKEDATKLAENLSSSNQAPSNMTTEDTLRHSGSYDDASSDSDDEGAGALAPESPSEISQGSESPYSPKPATEPEVAPVGQESAPESPTHRLETPTNDSPSISDPEEQYQYQDEDEEDDFAQFQDLYEEQDPHPHQPQHQFQDLYEEQDHHPHQPQHQFQESHYRVSPHAAFFKNADRQFDSLDEAVIEPQLQKERTELEKKAEAVRHLKEHCQQVDDELNERLREYKENVKSFIREHDITQPLELKPAAVKILFDLSKDKESMLEDEQYKFEQEAGLEVLEEEYKSMKDAFDRKAADRDSVKRSLAWMKNNRIPELEAQNASLQKELEDLKAEMKRKSEEEVPVVDEEVSSSSKKQDAKTQSEGSEIEQNTFAADGPENEEQPEEANPVDVGKETTLNDDTVTGQLGSNYDSSDEGSSSESSDEETPAKAAGPATVYSTPATNPPTSSPVTKKRKADESDDSSDGSEEDSPNAKKRKIMKPRGRALPNYQ
ncbi:hypothetical protein HYFRA_00004510 [Hymenoscyphus fraxineus]|uniref:Uncharacterized protein n=1 Tax=Hymenoscyphus fraxineus TaxID=746836 RepID=A0A9N9PTJ5_9HELO|nr:hypothetical protein HYFRA_00004510 [Hymenoscyphus fraxineus]